jgi:dihydroorotate dehydrogenase electron transfer subunit
MSAQAASTPSLNTRHVLEFTVSATAQVCDEHYRLTMRCAERLDAGPGQFLQLRCQRRGADEGAVSRPWSEGPVLLPRPFSIAGHRVVEGRSEVDVILRVVGRGTTWLASLRSGDCIQALGPLGNRFVIDPDVRKAYLVGGGCGLPPVIWLAEVLREAGVDVVVFCGARTARLLPLTLTGEPSRSALEPGLVARELGGCRAPVVVATDDGSLGVQGLVGTAMEAYHDAHRSSSGRLHVYTCGPEPMMRSVARWCLAQEIPCQVCMERLMACGIGTCQSCVVPVRTDPSGSRFTYRLCCKDGPVFDARDVVWEPPGGLPQPRCSAPGISPTR